MLKIKVNLGILTEGFKNSSDFGVYYKKRFKIYNLITISNEEKRVKIEIRQAKDRL